MSADFWLWLALIVGAVVVVLALVRRSIRRTQVEAALSLAQRGLSAEEIERVLSATQARMTEEAAYQELGECLAGLTLSGAVLQETMAAFAAADLPAKRALVKTVEGISDAGGEVTEEWLLGLVRGLRPSVASTPAEPSERFMTRAVN